MALTNSQYDELMRMYDERRQTREETVRERRSELYLAIPKLRAIDSKIADISVAKVRERLFSSDEDSASSASDTLSALGAEREALIRKAGFPSDYLDPPYICPDCRDTGFIDSERCHCFEKASIDLIYQQSRLSRSYARENFESFDLSYYSKDITDPVLNIDARTNAGNALAAAKDFVKNFKDGGENLLIYGNTGTGKTFLSHCIAKSLIDSAYSVIYLTAYQMFSIFEDKTFGRMKNAEERDPLAVPYERIFSCDLLVIDDLGSEFFNSFTVSRLFECINERLLRDNSTIISTNLDLAELKEIYSERLFSRLTDKYRMIRLFGSDIRIQKKLGGTANATQ